MTLAINEAVGGKNPVTWKVDPDFQAVKHKDKYFWLHNIQGKLVFMLLPNWSTCFSDYTTYREN